jgi:hypothetical protein
VKLSGSQSLSGHSAVSYPLRAWLPALVLQGGGYIEASLNLQPLQGEPHAHHCLATWRSNQRDIDSVAAGCFLSPASTGEGNPPDLQKARRVRFFCVPFIDHLQPARQR